MELNLSDFDFFVESAGFNRLESRSGGQFLHPVRLHADSHTEPDNGHSGR
jgi:hypothetical protein